MSDETPETIESSAAKEASPVKETLPIREVMPKLIKPQLIGLILETIKFAIAGILMTTFLSTQMGQKITAKVLPVLGFGNAAQTNLGLQLLVNEVKEEEFHDILKEIRKKIQFEMSSLFSKNQGVSPERRLELLTQLKGYAFSAIGVDLEDEVQKKLKELNQNLETNTIEALNYSQSSAAAQNNSEREKLFRELKILLMNRKYVNLLEKALPYWYQDETFVQLSLLAIIAMDQETPEVLHKMLSGPIIYQR
jgi:hypothetical protein